MPLPFPPEVVAAAAGPLVAVEPAPDGRPVGAIAAGRLPVEPARIWQMLADVERWGAHIPMIHHMHREGDRVTSKLRFRIALFSVGFGFTADASYEEGRWLELRWVSGEPRALRIRFELAPVEGGTVVYAGVAFDVMSLGWLVKFFLKHHPEILYGVFPGSALTLYEALRKSV
jgi:hypothetical protein